MDHDGDYNDTDNVPEEDYLLDDEVVNEDTLNAHHETITADLDDPNPQSYGTLFRSPRKRDRDNFTENDAANVDFNPPTV